jgi:hypothetical protein
MARIYYFIQERVIKENARYTAVEMFTEIANFMNFNYREMFHMLNVGDKNSIITELDAEFDVLRRQKIKTLF